MSAHHSPTASSGVIAPDGADIDNSLDTIDVAVSKARPWQRRARAGAYDPHHVQDQRSDDRQNF
jgi:hypothetical protein